MFLSRFKKDHPTSFSVSRGASGFLICALLLSLISALILKKMPYPTHYERPFSLVSLYLSALIAGLLSARGDNIKPSCILAGILFVLFLIMSPFSKAGCGVPLSALIYVMIPIAVFLGGIIRFLVSRKANSKRRKPYSKHRR